MRSIYGGVLALALVLFPSLAWAQPFGRTTSNQSAVIALANAFQEIIAAGNRQSLTIQNNNATNSCWIAFGTRVSDGSAITAGTATKAESILLLAGGSYTRYWPFIPTDAIIATCAGTSDTLYLDVQ
jgi:hypothetical protein